MTDSVSSPDLEPAPRPTGRAVEAGDLRGVVPFSNLDDGELRRLAESFVELEVPEDGVVVHDGDPADALYVLAEGAVSVFRDTVGSPVQLLDRLTRDDFFGEMSLFEGVTSPATVRATAPSRVLRIGRETLVTYLRDHPGVRFELETTAGRRHSANVAAALELGRRREVRMRLSHEVTLELEDGRRRPVRLENLSVGGFCVHGAPEDWHPESTVTFGLGLELGTVRLSGRVAWRRGDAVGLAFTELATNHDTIIQMAIRLLLDSR